jgi:hypothetical protein
MSVVAFLVLFTTYVGPGVNPASLVVPVIFFGVWVTLVWRISLVGLLVGDAGIRLHMMSASRVIPWKDVHRVLVVDVPQYRNRAIAIVTTEGRQIETPVWERVTLSVAPRGPGNRVSLPTAELEKLAADLDAMAAARTGRLRG